MTLLLKQSRQHRSSEIIGRVFNKQKSLVSNQHIKGEGEKKCFRTLLYRDKAGQPHLQVFIRQLRLSGVERSLYILDLVIGSQVQTQMNQQSSKWPQLQGGRKSNFIRCGHLVQDDESRVYEGGYVAKLEVEAALCAGTYTF